MALGQLTPGLDVGSLAGQMALSLSSGVSTNPAEWGQEFTVGPEYKGPHVKWPLTLENVQQVVAALSPSISLILPYLLASICRSVHPHSCIHARGRLEELGCASNGCAAQQRASQTRELMERGGGNGGEQGGEGACGRVGWSREASESEEEMEEEEGEEMQATAAGGGQRLIVR